MSMFFYSFEISAIRVICGQKNEFRHATFERRSQSFAAAARRDDHGRQRPLGEAARAAAHRGSSAGRGIRAHHHPHRRRTGHQVSHALRLFRRELEPPQGRGGCVDEISHPLSQDRNAGVEQKQRAAGSHRADLPPAGKRAGTSQEIHRDPFQKQRPHARHGVELRQPH